MSDNPVDGASTPGARLETIGMVLQRTEEMLSLARRSGLFFLLPHLERVKREALRLLAIAADDADV